MLAFACRVALAVIAVTLPTLAGAATVWMDWTQNGGGSATGVLPGGRSATFTSGTAAVQSINPASTGGTFYTASPSVPGLASGENSESVGIVTATPHPGILDANALIFEVELHAFAIDAETTIGLRDLQDITWYAIELLDANRQVLALTGLQVSTFDLSYNSGFVADLGVDFTASSGLIRSDNFHNLGSGYRHSGLVLFSNLPAATHFVRFLSGGTFQQNTEGLSFYLGGSAVPEPASAPLIACACLAWLAARRR